ncbi:MAG TPA: (d)CMP kinase [Candidatus Limnocylindrales bacterium]|nr:(d)CMP kinase [Candidatus Limnocylindrales bacterium]
MEPTNDATAADRAAPLVGLVVALDGPASSGKSSVGATAAVRLGYRFCDTGLLYRAVTWLALRRGVGADSIPALVALAEEIELVPDSEGRLAHVSVEGTDVTAEVHGAEVDVAVSAYARVGELRAALLTRQRTLAAPGRIVMAGRDIGTVVLPDADLKLYLDASPEERAQRRAMERGLDSDGPEAAEILDELLRRDVLDSTRPVAPLRPAPDALILRTDGNEFETTVEQVVDAIRVREVAVREVAEPPGDAPRSARRRRPTLGVIRRGRAAPTRIATRKTWILRLGSLVLRVIARAIIRIRVEGDLSAIPESGPLIIAANHASNADPVLIGAFLNGRLHRPLNWLGKRELVEMPVIGWFMREAGIHPVDRATADVGAFRTAIRVLESGNILTVFPEGTRSPDGVLQEVREGVAVLALRSGAPVLPVGVADSDKVWRKGSMFPTPGRSVTVRYGLPFMVADELPEIVKGDRRKAKEAATRLIMSRIAELLPPRQRGIYGANVEDPT